MNHWLRDATLAAAYAKHGWPTADQNAPKRQSFLARMEEYEEKLKALLECCTKPMSIPEIAEESGVILGTAKKYVSVLSNRKLLEREKRGTVFYYQRVKKPS